MKLTFFLPILMFGLAGDGYACKCGGPGTVQESFERTELISLRKSIKQRHYSISETLNEEGVAEVREGLKEDTQILQLFDNTYVLELELEIIEKYKGGHLWRTLIIYAPLLSASCRFRFQNDKHYIVYASSKNFMNFLLQNKDGTDLHERENTFGRLLH
jgi:CRISPR/Cas system-associated exonuclease Cas4 (RecB family)